VDLPATRYAKAGDVHVAYQVVGEGPPDLVLVSRRTGDGGSTRSREVPARLRDGLVATFDGPARAVRCALALRDHVHALGVRIRAGVHNGEIERRSGDVAGIGVHIAARVMALADADEVLVSRTVKDLVAGAGLYFRD
jgi:hypothetical protein